MNRPAYRDDVVVDNDDTLQVHPQDGHVASGNYLETNLDADDLPSTQESTTGSAKKLILTSPALKVRAQLETGA